MRRRRRRAGGGRGGDAMRDKQAGDWGEGED